MITLQSYAASIFIVVKLLNALKVTLIMFIVVRLHYMKKMLQVLILQNLEFKPPDLCITDLF